jgi:photosystem II stability/assembly factor-like uncharacterized protein
VIAATANAGSTWVAQHLGLAMTPDLTGISCPRLGMCMAVGSTGANPPTGTVLTTHNGGTVWQAAAAPAAALAVTSVECSSIYYCVALVSDGTIVWSASTPDFGRTWQRLGDLTIGLQDARDLWCGTDGTCLVAGNMPTTAGHAQGAIDVSSDGGTSWTAGVVPTGTGLLQAVACASSVRCLAAGTSSNTVNTVVPSTGVLLVSGDEGHTWFPARRAPPVDDIFGIACPAVTECALAGTRWVRGASVGTGGLALSVDAGMTFFALTSAYTPLTLTALACPSARACVAVGGNTVVRADLTIPPPTSGHRTKVTQPPPRPAPIR